MARRSSSLSVASSGRFESAVTTAKPRHVLDGAPIYVGVAKQTSQGGVKELLLEGDMRAGLPVCAVPASLRPLKLPTAKRSESSYRPRPRMV